MADETLGAYNIFDLRDEALRRVPKGLLEFVDRGALLGMRGIEQLRPELLHFSDSGSRRPVQTRADLRVLDTARAAAEGQKP